MALTSDDYLDIVNAVFDCLQLKEQQESTRLIQAKLEQLNSALVESHLKKQKKPGNNSYQIKIFRKKIT